MTNKRKILIIASISIIAASVSYIYFNRCPASDRIQKIDSYAQVADVLQAADENTLVLFDVDETLIIPASVTMRTKTKDQHQQWLKQTIESIFTSLSESEDYYFDYWAVTEIPFVIEPFIVATIKSLQNHGVKVLALTNLLTGSRGQISSLPEWRSAKLQQVGIDFNKVNIPDTIFTQLPEKNGTYPILYRGILATNQQSKGIVLGAFLDYMNWRPSKVIFFDDSLKRVKEVVDEMCKRGIPCIGYQYLGAEYVPGELNKDIALLQFKYLVEHEKWLSDEEAKELIKQQNNYSIPATNH